MKKSYSLYIIAITLIVFLSIFAFPVFSGKLEDYLSATVLKSENCPVGDGKTFDNEILIHVNKDISLPDKYIPSGLVPTPKEIKTTKFVCVKKDIVEDLGHMFKDAKKENINLAVTSGFRSKETQSFLYKALILLKGDKAKDRIAEPSHSEHQLGTTLDLSGESIGYLSADDKFYNSPEDLWLRDNAHKYGFVLSYSKEKTDITGYDYEPWHYRYLGIEVAKEVHDKNLSIEEFLDLKEIPAK